MNPSGASSITRLARLLVLVLSRVEGALIRRLSIGVTVVSLGGVWISRSPEGSPGIVWLVPVLVGILGCLFPRKAQLFLLFLSYFLLLTPIAFLWRFAGGSITRRSPGRSNWLEKEAGQSSLFHKDHRLHGIAERRKWGRGS